jgi:hypothetical protein
VPVKVIVDEEPEQIGLAPVTLIAAVGAGKIVTIKLSLTDGHDPSAAADIVIVTEPPLTIEAGIL